MLFRRYTNGNSIKPKKYVFMCLFWVFAMVLQASPVSAQSLQMNSATVERLNWVPSPEMGYDFALGREEHQEVFPYYGEDGSTDILLDSGADTVTVLQLDNTGAVKNRISIPKPLSFVGAFTKDEKGNMYILYGQNTNDPAKESVRFARYDKDGNLLNGISFSQMGVDTVAPFDCGCSMTVRDGRAIILFGRLIDSSHVSNETYGVVTGLRHQGSCLIFIDTENMDVLDMDLLSATHSLSQLTSYYNGTYYAIERGDGSPRAFQVRQYNKNGSSGNPWKSFQFKSDIGNAKDVSELEPEVVNGHTYVPVLTYTDINNVTFSVMGDVVNIGGDMYLTGAYENTTEDRYMSARNLFIQKIGDNSSPIYLTQYSDPKTAEVGAVRAVSLPNGNAAILYEENAYKFDGRSSYAIYNSGFSQSFNRNYIHVLEIDVNGQVVSDQKMETPEGVFLSCFDPVAYDQASETFRWISYSGRNLVFNTISENTQQTAVSETNPATPKTSADFADTANLSYSDKLIIDWGLENGIVSGSSDGLFHPWDLITKAEFAVMLVKTYDLPLQSAQGIFTDVPKTHWACSYIEALARENLVPSGGDFYPDSTITREEADKIVVLAGHLDENIDIEKSGGESVYSEIAKNCGIAAYYLGDNRELKRISAIQMMETSSNVLEVYYDRLARTDNWRARLKNGSGRVMDVDFVQKEK